VAGRASGL